MSPRVAAFGLAAGEAGTLAAVRGYSSEPLRLTTAPPTVFVQSTASVDAMLCQRGEALHELVPSGRE